jgi:exodeoxyribonuclease VII large subunit
MDDQDQERTNLAPVSVSELSGALKRTVEDRFGHVRVRGEVSGWRGPHSSGHCYFSLKDENARLDAVIWKGVFARMKTRPEEGVEVVATGKLTTFPGKSSYQIVVESVELAGLGALMALLEKRRQAFAKEGLFDQARKRPIPYLPAVIGVVTSPTGAVIRDILHRLSDRFPRRVLVWPVRVQGETSAQEVAAAVRGFDALAPDGPIPRPDLLIVARGGGSLEDLWGFNEEAVVRAVADCRIPVIAAVGHETDWTLIDHVADVRAPTPTAAAEMAVPVRGELLLRVEGLGLRALEALGRGATQTRRDLTQLSRRLPPPERLLEIPSQRLDRAGERMDFLARERLAERERRLARAAAALERHQPRKELADRKGALATQAARLAAFTPLRRVGAERDRLARLEAGLSEAARRLPVERARALTPLAARLDVAFVAATRLARGERRRRLDAAGLGLARALAAAAAVRAARLAGASALLESVSYRSVLARGYAVVRRATDAGYGPPVAGAQALAPGETVGLEFADGLARAEIRAGEGPPPAAPRPGARKPPRGGAGQGDLF